MDCADESNGYVRAQSADTIKLSFRCVIYDCTIRNFLWAKIYGGATIASPHRNEVLAEMARHHTKE
jgi:hypothetical protein